MTIESLKSQLRRAYTDLQRMEEDANAVHGTAGKAMQEMVRPEIPVQREECNRLIRLLKERDPGARDLQLLT